MITKQSHPPSGAMGFGVAIGLAAVLVMMLLEANQTQTAAEAIPGVPQASPQMTQARVGTTNIIRVATDAEYWPMEYISGTQIVGHDIDLMNAIALELNATVAYTDVAWANIFPGLVNGEYDAIVSSVSALPERDRIIDFTLPYVTFGIGDHIAIAVRQGDDALRHQLNQTLWQLRTEGVLETMVARIAADVPAWNPHLPEWPYVAPDASSTLVYSGTQQDPTIIQIPSGAVTQTILLAYIVTSIATPAPGYTFAGHAFQLDAYRDGVLLPDQTFGVPVTVTLHYTETAVAEMDEGTLKLLYWNTDAGTWEDASTTCAPPSGYDRHPNDNWLAVPVCHLSKFALFGQHRLYLPITLRN